MVEISLSSFMPQNRRRKRKVYEDDEFSMENDNFFDSDFDDKFTDFDPSVGFYPKPYCGVLEGKLESMCPSRLQPIMFDPHARPTVVITIFNVSSVRPPVHFLKN